MCGVLFQDGDASVFISGNIIEFPVELLAVSQRFHFLVWDSGHAHTGIPSSFYFLLPLALFPLFLPLLCPLSQILQLALSDTRKRKSSVDTPATSQPWNHAWGVLVIPSADKQKCVPPFVLKSVLVDRTDEGRKMHQCYFLRTL